MTTKAKIGTEANTKKNTTMSPNTKKRTIHTMSPNTKNTKASMIRKPSLQHWRRTACE